MTVHFFYGRNNFYSILPFTTTCYAISRKTWIRYTPIHNTATRTTSSSGGDGRSSMRALVYDYGSSRFIVSDGLSIPQPAAGEVLLRISGAAINPVDAMIPKMLVKFGVMRGEAGESYRVGVDGAGVVEQVGPGVSGIAAGDRVIYHKPTLGANQHGGFAEYSVVPAAACVPVPAAMDDQTATAIPCAAWTAYQVVTRKCNVRPGDTVLVYGASGGTGSFVTTFCKAKGASTIIAVCSAAKHEYVRKLGATHTIDYKTEDVVARVNEITAGAGVRVSVDLVGAESFRKCVSLTRFSGVVCPAATPSDAGEFYKVLTDTGTHSKALTVAFVGFGGGHGKTDGSREEMMEIAKEATNLIADAALPVEVSKIVTLDDLPAVLDEIASSSTRGKAILLL